MNKKRTSLEAALEEAPSVAEPESMRRADPSNRTDKTSSKRRGIKQQTAYLAVPVYEQVRRTLLMEGLDWVFKDRGLPSIAELTSKKPH